VGAWVYTYKRVLRFAVLGIAALVLVFWNQPTGKVIVVIALCVLVALAIIEFLGRPPSPAAPEVVESERSPAEVAVNDSAPTAEPVPTDSQTHDTTEADVRG
jgi:hypothetical protein